MSKLSSIITSSIAVFIALSVMGLLPVLPALIGVYVGGRLVVSGLRGVLANMPVDVYIHVDLRAAPVVTA